MQQRNLVHQFAKSCDLTAGCVLCIIGMYLGMTIPILTVVCTEDAHTSRHRSVLSAIKSPGSATTATWPWHSDWGVATHYRLHQVSFRVHEWKMCCISLASSRSCYLWLLQQHGYLLPLTFQNIYYFLLLPNQFSLTPEKKRNPIPLDCP